MANQSRLEYGIEKLDSSLDMLEAAIIKFGKKQKKATAKTDDAVALKKQNDELNRELAELKAKSVVLEDANNEVAERLDAAVANIGEVLRAV